MSDEPAPRPAETTRRLTSAQRRRLQELLRPNYHAPPMGVISATDWALAERGLVVLRLCSEQNGFSVTRITDEGRLAVEPDDYEYCGCGGLSHRGESACIHCGDLKESAQ